MKIKIPRDSMLKMQPLEKGWYQAKVTNLEVKQSKDKQSVNYVFTLMIKKDGREVNALFNSKNLGFMTPFYIAVTNQRIEVPAPGEDFDLDTDVLINQDVDVELIQDVFNGLIVQKVNAFAPAGSTAPF